MTSSADPPDSTFTDANCDGIDGVVAAGVFVSPSGVDTNPGTMAMPVLTITHAIMLAHASHGDVYVDHGTYAESLMLVDGVGVYGGYDRTVSRAGSIAGYWDRRADATTTIMGGATAVEATGIMMGATIDRLTIHAADGAAGQSSIVVWAHGSTGTLTVSASTLIAGAGASAAPSAVGMAGMNGGNGMTITAGTSPCSGPIGGTGGMGGSINSIGMAGTAGGAFAGPPMVAGGPGGMFGIPSGAPPFCTGATVTRGRPGRSARHDGRRRHERNPGHGNRIGRDGRIVGLGGRIGRHRRRARHWWRWRWRRRRKHRGLRGRRRRAAPVAAVAVADVPVVSAAAVTVAARRSACSRSTPSSSSRTTTSRPARAATAPTAAAVVRPVGPAGLARASTPARTAVAEATVVRALPVVAGATVAPVAADPRSASCTAGRAR